VINLVNSKKKAWLWINILGGAAVIGSYIFGFVTHPDASEILWGGVPAGIRPFYTLGMILAAISYLVIAYFLLRANEPEIKIFGRYSFGFFNILYPVILIPSALWMPLTFLAIEKASPILASLVKADLAMVAAGSLALFYTILKIRLSFSSWYLFPVLASVGFCFQTVILDAIVWAYFFRV
jgi:hypothetical protein